MKKNRKKILGLVGLALVAAVTTFAALLPDSGASALDTNPITDEVQVRVVGKTPEITLTSPENNKIYLDPETYFQFNFASAATTTAEIRYTDKGGVQHIYTIDTEDPDYYPGTSIRYPLDLSSDGYGYGDYILTIKGVGFDGVTAEDTVKFSYYPLYGEVGAGKENGIYEATPYYDEEDESIASVYINVYGPDGKLIPGLSSIKATGAGNKSMLDFVANGLSAGEYTIEFVALDADGNTIYKPYVVSVFYKEDEPDVPGTSDTGRFVGGIGLSSTDIIITSVMGLVAAATVAIALVIRHSKDKKSEQ